MGLMDKLAEGAERAAREAEKAFDKGKTKVGELQVEMQMDGLAKKLGYLVFDFYRGRQVDQALRQRILDDMSRLEDQLLRTRSQAGDTAQSEEVAGATAEPNSDTGNGQAAGAAGATAESAPTSEAGASSPSAEDVRSGSDPKATPTGEASPVDETNSADSDSPTVS